MAAYHSGLNCQVNPYWDMHWRRLGWMHSHLICIHKHHWHGSLLVVSVGNIAAAVVAVVAVACNIAESEEETAAWRSSWSWIAVEIANDFGFDAVVEEVIVEVVVVVYIED